MSYSIKGVREQPAKRPPTLHYTLMGRNTAVLLSEKRLSRGRPNNSKIMVSFLNWHPPLFMAMLGRQCSSKTSPSTPNMVSNACHVRVRRNVAHRAWGLGVRPGLNKPLTQQLATQVPICLAGRKELCIPTSTFPSSSLGAE